MASLPKTAYCKCHQLHRASTLPLGPKSLKVKYQTFPHDGPVDWRGLLNPLQDWGSGPLSPPRSPPSCHRYHHGAGAKGATGCGRLAWDFLGWHRGYLLCLYCLLQGLLIPNMYYLGCYKKNNYKNIHHPSTSLLLGWTNIFPTVSSGPWVSDSLMGKRSFPAFKILRLLQSW